MCISNSLNFVLCYSNASGQSDISMRLNSSKIMRKVFFASCARSVQTVCSSFYENILHLGLQYMHTVLPHSVIILCIYVRTICKPPPII